MKKKLTSMLSAALACVMCLGLLTVPASAAKAQISREEAAEQFGLTITGDYMIDFGTVAQNTEAMLDSIITLTNNGSETLHISPMGTVYEITNNIRFKFGGDLTPHYHWVAGLEYYTLEPGKSGTFTVRLWQTGHAGTYEDSIAMYVGYSDDDKTPIDAFHIKWESVREDASESLDLSAEEMDFGTVDVSNVKDCSEVGKILTVANRGASTFVGKLTIKDNRASANVNNSTRTYQEFGFYTLGADGQLSGLETVRDSWDCRVGSGETLHYMVFPLLHQDENYQGEFDATLVLDGYYASGGTQDKATMEIPLHSTIVHDGGMSFSIHPSSNSRADYGTTTSWGNTYEDRLPYGTDKTYSVQPGPGYRVAAAYVDGVNVGPVASYTFSDVRANHTIRFMLAKEDWHYFYLPASDSLYADHQYTGTSSTTDENGDKQTVYIYPEGTQFYSVLGDSGYGKVNYDTPENPDDDGSLDLAQPFAAEKAGQVYRLRSYTVGYSGSDFGTYVYVMCQGQPDPNEFDIFDPAKQPSYWAVEQVNAAIAANIVPKALQSKYTQSITRAEFCALAVQLYETLKGAAITERAEFTDTSDVNVQKMAGLGVVNGVGDNKFAPNDKLTREEAATMLSRLAKAVGKPLTTQAAAFADKASISSWALEAVGQMQKSGIMNGVGDNKFDPWGAYTREQSILTMLRMFEHVK